MTKKFAAGLAIVAILHATTAGAATPTKAPIKTAIVGSSECLITALPSPQGEKAAFLPALLAILVPVLVDKAIDAVSTELKRVKTDSSTGKLDYELFEYSFPAKNPDGTVPASFPTIRQPMCLTIITGRFSGDRGALRETAVKTDVAIPAGATREVLQARLRDNDYGNLAEGLMSVFEVELIPSEDRTAFTYLPRYYKAFELLPKHGAKTQGVVYNLSMLGSGPTPNGTQYSLASIKVGDVSAGLELPRNKLAKMETGYIDMPGLSTPSYRAYKQRRALGPDGTARFRFMPVSLKAELVQTQNPSDAAVFVANVLAGAKAKIVEKVGSELAVKDPFVASQSLYDAKIAAATATVELSAARAANNQDAIAVAQLKLDKANALIAELQK